MITRVVVAPHGRLLSEVLLPLHLPAARLDGISPVGSLRRGLYHEPLVQCLVRLLGREPALLTDALPQPREGNGSKTLRAAARLSPREHHEIEGSYPTRCPLAPPHPHTDHSTLNPHYSSARRAARHNDGGGRPLTRTRTRTPCLTPTLTLTRTSPFNLNLAQV